MLSFREYAPISRNSHLFPGPAQAPDINLHERKLNNTMVSADLTFQAPKKKKFFLLGGSSGLTSEVLGSKDTWIVKIGDPKFW